MAKGKKIDEVKKEVELENETSDIGNKNNKEDNTKEKETKETSDNQNTESTENTESKETENIENKLLRLQADFLNFKNRTEKEKLSTYGNAVSGVICDLLPVIDNLERAIAAEKSDTDNFKEGVVLVYNQLMGILNKKGLKEVEALHKPFDHNLHYGVAFEECQDYDDGIIIDVLQKGYTVNDKLIRPAMVRICKKP